VYLRDVPFPLKNPFDVLKSKEQEMVKVKKEVDALRVTIKLIGDEGAPPAADAKVDLRSVIEMP
jgi:hypothetical protein